VGAVKGFTYQLEGRRLALAWLGLAMNPMLD